MILYQAADGRSRVEVRFEGETAWLSLGQMAELFQRDKSVISRHVKNVFEEGELTAQATVAKFATVQSEGARAVTRDVEYFNLDVIISVGYRVKSQRGTPFRIWATQRLREYLVKGFTLDDDRLHDSDSSRSSAFSTNRSGVPSSAASARTRSFTCSRVPLCSAAASVARYASRTSRLVTS